MTREEYGQEYEKALQIENPWERATRMQWINTGVLLNQIENEIESDINFVTEYGVQSLQHGMDYLQSLINRHNQMLDRRNQLKAKMEVLEQIIDDCQ